MVDIVILFTGGFSGIVLKDFQRDSDHMGSSFLVLPLWPSVSELWPSVSKLWPSVSELWPSVSKLWPSASELWPSVSKLWPSVSELWPSVSALSLSDSSDWCTFPALFAEMHEHVRACCISLRNSLMSSSFRLFISARLLARSCCKSVVERLPLVVTFTGDGDTSVFCRLDVYLE